MSGALYGLIGESLRHSFSQRFFNEKFARDGIAARYELFELQDIGDIMELIAEYPMLRGLNVTIPYKRQVMPYLDEVDNVAQAAGAVNTIKIERCGDDVRLVGTNTDVVGFDRSLPRLDYGNALVLGTGGASGAVAQVLSQRGIAFEKVSRDEKAGCVTYEEVSHRNNGRVGLIVNCTPVGTYPAGEDAFPALDYARFTQLKLGYDLVYNPPVTGFMKKCAARGAAVKNGLEMLTEQAVASWEFWK